MSDRDRTNVKTPQSAKKKQQQLKRQNLAQNLARARRAQAVTQVGTPVAQADFDELGMPRGLDFDESSVTRSPTDTATPNYYEDVPSEVDLGVPPYPLTPGTTDVLNHGTDFLRRIDAEIGSFGLPHEGLSPPPPSPWTQLDHTTRADSVADISHGAAYDAVGRSDLGTSASIGLDRDPVLHMDDFAEALGDIQEILRSQVKTETTAENRRKATEILRASPGVMALIRAQDYKFEDFMTNGEIDMGKLTTARADLQERIQSSEESYKLAAKAHGYAANGAAYPIAGINNIVAGNRRVRNSKYTMYQGPQYANG